MDASVKPETTPHILSFDEWQATQYAPHRADQTDPTKPMGQGRILTFDEWQKAQSAGNPSTLQFPAMPKIASDRLNKTAGTALTGQYQMGPTPEQQAGSAIRGVSGALDVAAPNFGAGGALVAHGLAAVGRQAVAPAVENPALTAAMVNPVGAVVGAGMAIHTIATYGWQQAKEHFMSPEDRAKAEADPDRVSGEAAAVQAAMLGLGAIAGIHGALSKVGDVSEGVTAAGASGVRSLYELSKGAEAERPYVQSANGAEVLGTAAAAHDLPATASPYQPETPLDHAWQKGHAEATATVRDQFGALRRNLKTVSTDALQSEWNKLAETNNAEEAAHAAVRESRAREDYGALPSMEKSGRSRRNFDEFGNKVQRQAEDLPDAGGELDPDKLAADNKTVRDYNKSAIIRQARTRAMDRIQAEIDRREAGAPTDFNFGSNVAPEGATPPAGGIREDLGQGVKPAATGEPAAPAQGQLAPVEGTGPTRTRGLAAGVESKTVEAGLTARLGDLPEYRQLNMADQAAKATNLLQQNPELARSVALGETPAPEGLHPEAAFVAVENKAIAEGDVATIRDLASSKLTEQATTMGQRIRTLGERAPDSPVSAIQDIEEARGARTSGKPVDDMAASLLKQTAKAHPDVLNESTLAKLINSLRC